jgi:hypothetical protein
VIVILVGSAAVWALVTTSTGGNWQAGLVVAGVVFCMTMGGMRRRREELHREERAQAAREVMDALYAPEPRRRWFR